MLVYVIDSGLVGRDTTRAADAQETPTQSHISPSILVSEDDVRAIRRDQVHHVWLHLGYPKYMSFKYEPDSEALHISVK